MEQTVAVGAPTAAGPQSAPGAGNTSAASPPSTRRLTRSMRVLLMLLAVWVLSGFDLAFTLQQAKTHYFTELNPLAARLLYGPPHALFAYKFGLLGTSTVILMCLRRHTVAELACWLLLASSLYVGVRWYVYYQQALVHAPNMLVDLAW